MFHSGDLVKVKKDSTIPAFAGVTGIIIQNLGEDAAQVVVGKNEHDNFYYEVNITAQGNQILLGRELTLLRKA